MLDNAISRSALGNVLGFFTPTGDLKIDQVGEFLDISRAELAGAFGMNADKLRPERMSTLTQERIKQLAAALEYVAETFDGDVTKSKQWINSPNLNFGGSSPKSVILKGRANKVIKFILAAKEGY